VPARWALNYENALATLERRGNGSRDAALNAWWWWWWWLEHDARLPNFRREHDVSQPPTPGSGPLPVMK
jgi:hypothetical protein